MYRQSIVMRGEVALVLL